MNALIGYVLGLLCGFCCALVLPKDTRVGGQVGGPAKSGIGVENGAELEPSTFTHAGGSGLRNPGTHSETRGPVLNNDAQRDTGPGPSAFAFRRGS